jgi:hypothetical protein
MYGCVWVGDCVLGCVCVIVCVCVCADDTVKRKSVMRYSVYA